jgi:hypothetical protein
VSLNKSIIISFAMVLVAGAAIGFAASAQSPSRHRRVVRVVSNTSATAPAAAAAAKAATTAPASPAARAGAAAGVPAVPAVPEVLISRENYSYSNAGHRDPFVSLMNTQELRPLIGDLKLVAIAFDPTGRNSVAVLRDLSTKEQYRVKVGQELGRMRVAAIREKEVVFGIEEFGYSRQESVAMNDSTKVRMQ